MDTTTINTGTFTLSGPGGGVAGVVTYNAANKTASFSPSTSFDFNTLYTASITTGATSLGGTAMSSQKNWTFTTTSEPDTTPPAISFTDPSDSASGVSITGSISITFSEAMNGATIDGSSITLRNGSNVIPGAVTYDSATHVATFTPSSVLSYLTLYTVTVGTGVADLAGNHLATQYSWSFLTQPQPDTIAPTVSSTSPSNGATGVSVSPSLVVTFSEAMSPDTINNSSITVNGVTGLVNYNTSNNTATFTPDTPLAYDTSYTATVGTAAADLAGNHLASPYSWSFVTGPVPDTTTPVVVSTSPSDGATDVSVNAPITATFSEPMKSLTINSSTFTVNGVAGIVSFNSANNTVTFSPSAPFANNITYTATITTGVEDLAGNALATNKTWTFTTMYPYGDVEGNGTVDIKDALLALRMAAGLVTPTAEQLSVADVAPLVNGTPQPDGKLDIGDVLVILLKVVGMVNL